MSHPVVESGYQFVFRACRSVRPEFRSLLYAFGLIVSPAIAIGDEARRQRRSLLGTTFLLVPFVLLFSFGFNFLFSLVEGRLLWDSTDATINFLEDRWNIALYLLICPAYVSLGLQIVMISSHYPVPSPVGRRPPSRIDSLRSPMALTLALSLAAVFAANYIADVAVGTGGQTYWFNDRVAGIRVLNGAGIYYAFMTFGFLFITILAALNYVSIAQTAVILARSLQPEECRKVEAMRWVFLRFGHAFVLARWLIAVFMIHTIIWSRSPLSQTENIHIAGGLLVVAAFVLTAIPAHYVDRKVSGLAAGCGLDPAELGITPVAAKRWLWLADWIIVGLGFTSILWGWEPVSEGLNWLFGESRI
ncbi:MAG TPA: hypothetical protein VF603_06515 [Allosphingosinicella sp.]|jgi:hypothetical protein